LIEGSFRTFLKQSQKNWNLSFVLTIKKRRGSEKKVELKEMPTFTETKSGKLKLAFGMSFLQCLLGYNEQRKKEEMEIYL